MCQAWKLCSHFHTCSTGQSSVPGPHPAPRGARKSPLVCAQEGEASSSFCHIGIPLPPSTNESECSLSHQEGSMEEWSASPHDGVSVAYRGPEVLHTHRDPSPLPPSHGRFPGHMGTELNYQLSQDGVVSFGRAKKGGLSQIFQATHTNESKSHLFSQGQRMVIL